VHLGTEQGEVTQFLVSRRENGWEGANDPCNRGGRTQAFSLTDAIAIFGPTDLCANFANNQLRYSQRLRVKRIYVTGIRYVATHLWCLFFVQGINLETVFLILLCNSPKLQS